MYKKEVLENGVRIITEEIPHVRSVCIGIWVGVGSRNETPENNGVSHFVEHMMFKGTENRSAKDIAEALDAVGGQLNAFTSKEYTCYYAKVLDDNIDLAIDILADMVFKSSFDEHELEKEKNVVLEEIKMYEDTPDELVHDVFTHTIWQGHPLGRPIIGTQEIISSLSRDAVIKYYNDFYRPTNIVVSVAGNINHDKVMAHLKPYFISLTGKHTQSQRITPALFPDLVFKNKEIEQTHFCIGTEGLPLNHERSYPLNILNNILGGGISSRLFQKIREEQGLAYSVFSSHSSYLDSGLFSIYAGISPRNVQKVIELVVKELESIKKNNVTSHELERSKAQIKGNMFLGLENVSSRMSRLGKSETCLGRVLSLEEVATRIDKVTLEDIQLLAEDMFQLDKFAFTSLGPQQSDEKLGAILGRN